MQWSFVAALIGALLWHSNAAKDFGSPKIDVDCSLKLDGNYPSLDHKCSQMYVTCAGGLPIPRSCPGNTFFDKTSGDCLAWAYVEDCGGTATTSTTTEAMAPIASEFDCTSREDGLYANDRKPCDSVFYACVGGTTIRQMCAEPFLSFDEQSGQCMESAYVAGCGGSPTEAAMLNLTAFQPDELPVFSCRGQSLGNHPDPTQQCSSVFFTCIGAANGITRKCALNTYYDEELDRCLFFADVPNCSGTARPETTTVPVPIAAAPGELIDFDCSGLIPGNYPDPHVKSGCSKEFYTCSAAGIPTHMLCPGDTYYDDELNTCAFFREIPKCSGTPRPVSTSTTMEPIPYDCSKLPDGNYAPPAEESTCPAYFYQCANNRGFRVECATSGLRYSVEMNSCVSPSDVPGCDMEGEGQSSTTTEKTTTTMKTTPMHRGLRVTMTTKKPRTTTTADFENVMDSMMMKNETAEEMGELSNMTANMTLQREMMEKKMVEKLAPSIVLKGLGFSTDWQEDADGLPMMVNMTNGTIPMSINGTLNLTRVAFNTDDWQANMDQPADWQADMDGAGEWQLNMDGMPDEWQGSMDDWQDIGFNMDEWEANADSRPIVFNATVNGSIWMNGTVNGSLSSLPFNRTNNSSMKVAFSTDDWQANMDAPADWQADMDSAGEWQLNMDSMPDEWQGSMDDWDGHMMHDWDDQKNDWSDGSRRHHLHVMDPWLPNTDARPMVFNATTNGSIWMNGTVNGSLCMNGTVNGSICRNRMVNGSLSLLPFNRTNNSSMKVAFSTDDWQANMDQPADWQADMDSVGEWQLNMDQPADWQANVDDWHGDVGFNMDEWAANADARPMVFNATTNGSIWMNGTVNGSLCLNGTVNGSMCMNRTVNGSLSLLPFNRTNNSSMKVAFNTDEWQANMDKPDDWQANVDDWHGDIGFNMDEWAANEDGRAMVLNATNGTRMESGPVPKHRRPIRHRRPTTTLPTTTLSGLNFTGNSTANMTNNNATAENKTMTTTVKGPTTRSTTTLKTTTRTTTTLKTTTRATTTPKTTTTTRPLSMTTTIVNRQNVTDNSSFADNSTTTLKTPSTPSRPTPRPAPTRPTTTLRTTASNIIRTTTPSLRIEEGPLNVTNATLNVTNEFDNNATTTKGFIRTKRHDEMMDNTDDSLMAQDVAASSDIDIKDNIFNVNLTNNKFAVGGLSGPQGRGFLGDGANITINHNVFNVAADDNTFDVNGGDIPMRPETEETTTGNLPIRPLRQKREEVWMDNTDDENKEIGASSDIDIKDNIFNVNLTNNKVAVGGLSGPEGKGFLGDGANITIDHNVFNVAADDNTFDINRGDQSTPEIGANSDIGIEDNVFNVDLKKNKFNVAGLSGPEGKGFLGDGSKVAIDRNVFNVAAKGNTFDINGGDVPMGSESTTDDMADDNL